MSPTRNYSSAGALDSRGFTMVELLIGMCLALFLTAAMLLSYTFIVRSLIRSSNQQQLEVQSRRMLQLFTKDVHIATDVPSSSASQVILRLPNGSSSTSFFDVAYAYDASAGNHNVTLLKTDGTTATYPYTTVTAGTLTRIDSSNGALTLLTGMSNFSFNYLDKLGSQVNASYPFRIKQIEIGNFTVSAGSAITGTQSSYTGASARLILRSKHLVKSD